MTAIDSITLFTRSGKRRADIKQIWWNPGPWLKCSPSQA